ncbi:HEPN domain-containing protein [bacterium]|nr:HEPN domain-containing protein [bacterium]
MKSPLDAGRGLLQKAGHDLFAGRTVAATGEALDTVCFHAQQAAEKSLKAVLALHEVVYPFTHDLGTLIGLSAKLRVEVLAFEDAAEDLMEYAVRGRYDEALYPDQETANQALATAQRIFDWAASIVLTGGGEAERAPDTSGQTDE